MLDLFSSNDVRRFVSQFIDRLPWLGIIFRAKNVPSRATSGVAEGSAFATSDPRIPGAQICRTLPYVLPSVAIRGNEANVRDQESHNPLETHFVFSLKAQLASRLGCSRGRKCWFE